MTPVPAAVRRFRTRTRLDQTRYILMGLPLVKGEPLPVIGLVEIPAKYPHELGEAGNEH